MGTAGLSLGLVDLVVLKGESVGGGTVSLRADSTPLVLQITRPAEKHLVKIKTRKRRKGEYVGQSIAYRLVDPDGVTVAEDTEIAGCPVTTDDWVLLPFPSANRDPEMFDRADEFVIDRAKNRHSAFGLGIHRCLGSNLARMELTVAIEEWMDRFPDFELADPDAVRWSTGQVRGPRNLPIRINGRDA